MAVNKTIKYLLFFFNFLFWVSGCIILGVSIYMKVSMDGNVFFISLLLIFILLLAAGIVAAVDKDKVNDWTKERLNDLDRLPLQDQTAEIKTDVQKLEAELKCCGLTRGPGDWGGAIPSSCHCNDHSQPCENIGGQMFYSTPCSTLIIRVLEDNMVVVLGIAFAIAILLIFGMAFAMTLYCQIGKKEGPTTA
ncbi:tetraspanin-8-like isoform X2 [Gadus chalcogrammus]|uniref:tetraspanin-8-like isoform X2 n=1 Tax=Gadus chalcogrammus TaxID=1042646 RepID=UPI0024C372F0|nr:tetraspanin-8-like isoform X2 [Gadus chalcogrammus]